MDLPMMTYRTSKDLSSPNPSESSRRIPPATSAGPKFDSHFQLHPVQGVHVTVDYFSVLGAPVIAGRTFTAAEDSPHGGNVVVLSYGLWKRRFGGDRGIVGKSIQLNGQP